MANIAADASRTSLLDFVSFHIKRGGKEFLRMDNVHARVLRAYPLSNHLAPSKS